MSAMRINGSDMDSCPCKRQPPLNRSKAQGDGISQCEISDSDDSQRCGGTERLVRNELTDSEEFGCADCRRESSILDEVYDRCANRWKHIAYRLGEDHKAQRVDE